MPWICGSCSALPDLSLRMTEAVGFLWSSAKRAFFGMTMWTRLDWISSRLLMVLESSPWRARW